MTPDGYDNSFESTADSTDAELEAKLEALAHAERDAAPAEFEAWVTACTEPGSVAPLLDRLGAQLRHETDADFEARLARTTMVQRHPAHARRSVAGRVAFGRSMTGRLSRFAAVVLLGVITGFMVWTPSAESPDGLASGDPGNELAMIELASLIAVEDYVERLDDELIEPSLDLDFGGAFESIDSFDVDSPTEEWEIGSGLNS